MKEYIKQNKILLAIIVLLLVAGIYFAILNCQHEEPAVTPQTQAPAPQINNINGSEGFSVNGDVTNTQVVTTSGDNNKVTVPSPGTVPSGEKTVDKSQT